MLLRCFIFCFLPFVLTISTKNTNRLKQNKVQDSDTSDTSFIPQFGGFQPFHQFQPQPIFQPPHDLAALQQTHVLGDFQNQHRFQPFQPQKLNLPPQFNPGSGSQLLFSQQTDFSSQPRPNHGFQEPQPPTHFPVTHPGPGPGPAPQTFLTLPHPQPFPQRSQSPRAPTPQPNRQLSPAGTQPLIRFPQTSPPNNFQQQQQQRQAPTGPSGHQFNQPPLTPNRHVYQTLPPHLTLQNHFPASGGTGQGEIPPNHHPVHQPLQPHPSFIENPQPQPVIIPRHPPVSAPQDAPPLRPRLPPPPPLQEPQRPQVDQAQFVQPPVSFNPSRKPAFIPTPLPPVQNDVTTPQYQFNILHTRPEQHPSEQFINHNQEFNTFRPQTERPPSFNIYQNTEQPFPATNPPQFKPINDDSYLLQKSQEQTQYRLEGDFFENKQNEVFSKPREVETPVQTTLRPLKTTKPPQKTTTTVRYEIPPHLYVKEPKQYKEINIVQESQQKKTVKKLKKEKTQEELINEHIQKLLASQNLEIVNPPKDSKSSELTLPDGSKSKFDIKIIGSDLLNQNKPKKVQSTPPLPDLPDHIKKQYDIKLVQKDELFKQFKIGAGGKIVANEDQIAPLPNQLVKNSSTPIYLANGQQLEILKYPHKEAAKEESTTRKPPKVLLEELKQEVIPEGSDFELIRQNENGEIETVGEIPKEKKVTFVLLEEQPDGTVKVQGVKGNENVVENPSGGSNDLESIIKKIKDGSLKLPPSTKSKGKSIATNEIPRETVIHLNTSPAPTIRTTDYAYPSTYYSETTTPSDIFPTGPDNSLSDNYSSEGFSFAPTAPPQTDITPINFIPTSPTYQSKRAKSKSRPSYTPTQTTPSYSPTTRPTVIIPKRSSKRKLPTPIFQHTTPTHENLENYNHRSSDQNGEGPIPQDVIAEETNVSPQEPLNHILKTNGLHAMAKFLDQSGLDTILNETGPYTIFAPSDAAFKALQVQLGGPDKAEDKFRENPRLLSGLLLHHVVPGAFRIEDLQDEMTGVSLAGTQLRVNTYTTQDNEFKDQKVVTINGAKVLSDKTDIVVPQGVVHSVDKVMFPLPVGDIFQTLRGDRERKFTKFLKALHASGLTELLTGSKTYTLFAPTNKAFSALTDAELDKLLSRREAARTIVLRHIVPGTLYSAGMQYFQVKESMERGQRITLYKDSGKVKANTAQVVTPNIPTTNGVVHAVEALL